MSEQYNEAYYKSNNYVSYLQRGPRYYKLAEELTGLLRSIKLDQLDQPVLDYGCAIGFLVAAMYDQGWHNISGYDISDWAVSYGNKNLGVHLTTTTHVLRLNYYMITMLDVLEHMEFEKITELFCHLQAEYLVLRIPVTHSVGGKFILNVSENDKSHITRMPKDEWIKLFKALGYDLLIYLNLYSIYDSEGVLACIMKKSHS